MTEQVSTPESDLISNEQKEWRRVLVGNNKGANIEIKPLPTSVNLEVRKNLKSLGLRLFYIPSLQLHPEILERRDVDTYLQFLNKLYPNWKSYELLDTKERRDTGVVRNLQKWYWQMVKDGRIDFPKLPGEWVAVETVMKPRAGEKYPMSPLIEKLGFHDRFNEPCNFVEQTLKQETAMLLAAIGLSPRNANPKLLDALSWNLLANREGWGQTNTSECTSTAYHPSIGNPEHVVIGNSEKGGAAFAFRAFPHHGSPDVGFRLAIAFR